MKTILIIGLGNVGLPTAEYIAQRDFLVEGFDISQERRELAKKAGIKILNDISETKADAIVVCVGTGFSKGIPDMRAVYKVAADIRALKNKPEIVSFESTMYPGTTRYLAEQLLNNEIKHVFVCPHRWWKTEENEYGVDVLRVFSYVYEHSREVGIHFYREALEIPALLMSKPETVEVCKIVENGRRYVDISYAEYIKMLCDEYEIDFDEVRLGVNTHFAHEMKEARDGIGGECLPLAMDYLNHMLNSSLIESSKETDKIYRNKAE